MTIFQTMIVGFFLMVYLLPCLLAYGNKNKNAFAITVFTLLFGWTFIGWGIGVVWALTNHRA